MSKHITFIPIEKLLELQANEADFILVDAGSAKRYATRHVPGALSIPAAEIADKAAEQLKQKDQVIVVYCGGYSCDASTVAVKRLLELEYTNVLDYKAGISGWEAADLFVASLPTPE